jgi:SHS2 domain-containing protein
VPVGVRFLDHTADVGIAVEARSAEELFHRAALGMRALLRGDDDLGPSDSVAPATLPADAEPGRAPAGGARRPPTTIRISTTGRDWTTVLAGWLRELLYFHGVEGRDYVAARFDRLDASGVDAAVRTEPSTGAVREIKGVTYHELTVEAVDGGWRARVIFDV